MPNAAASFDDDFGYDEPRRPAPRKPRATPKKPKARKGKTGKHFGFKMVKVARYGAIGMTATVALGIMVNALALQKGHHPAPLFGKAITLAEPKPAGTPAPSPLVHEAVVAPSGRQDQAGLAALAVPPLPVAKPRPGIVSVGAERGSSDDAIGRLLRGEAPTSANKSETKTILAAQKALAKIGYAIKPDGSMGPAMRKAIEAFEKDHNLPVKGDLSRRVVKILVAESGVKID